MKEIIGIRAYSFADQKTGELIEGYTLYLSWIDSNVEGVACEAVSITKDRLEGYTPALGDKVKVGYNRWGKADFVVKL